MQVDPRGLIPALLLALSVALAPAHAQTITPALKACMAVPSGPARLDCYDREMSRIEGVAPMRSSSAAATSPPASAPLAAAPAASADSAPRAATAPPATPAPLAGSSAAPDASESPGGSAAAVTTTPPASAPPAQPPEKQFGLAPVEPKGMPSRITARVASATRQSSGRYMITLENGEVWLQTDDELGFQPRKGGSVSIKRGMLGAFWMSDKYYVVAVKRLH